MKHIAAVIDHYCIFFHGLMANYYTKLLSTNGDKIQLKTAGIYPQRLIFRMKRYFETRDRETSSSLFPVAEISLDGGE
jgi:hypothetical protein